MAAVIAPFLPQSSDPPPKAARSGALLEPTRHAPDAPSNYKRNLTESAAAKLLAPGFVDWYDKLTLAIADVDRAPRDDHTALRTPLAVLQNYMSLQPFKIGASGFSAAFDSTVLPRLMSALTAFLLQLHYNATFSDGSGDGAVSVALANECLLCLVNMSACDGQMVKMMIKHGVANIAVRMLAASRVPTNMLENAAWILGVSRQKLCGDTRAKSGM